MQHRGRVAAFIIMSDDLPSFFPSRPSRSSQPTDAIVNSEEVSNYVDDDDDDAEDGDDDLDVVEGSADMPLDI